MTFEWWFAYLLTSIILSLSPGSGAINTMTTSISHGYRGAAASIAGLQTGLGIHIVLVGIGLGTLFSQSILAFEVLKWAGAAYLIWLGIQQWRAARLNRPEHAGAYANPWTTVQTRRVRQSDQPEKHRLSSRAVSAVYRPASAAGDAVHRAWCDDYYCRYHRDDWLRDAGAADCGMD